LEHLEDYLKQEALYDVIPEYRKSSLVQWPSTNIVIVWLIGLWFFGAYILFPYKGPTALLLAVVGLGLSCGLALAPLLIFLVARKLRSGKTITEADNGLLGGCLAVGFPSLFALYIALQLGSWSAGITYAVVAIVGGSMLLYVLQTQAYRIHLAFELVRTALLILRRSITVLIQLAPILLAVVLLSVFSQELWQVLGSLSPWRLLGVVLLLSIAFVLTLASVTRLAVEIISAFPPPETIVENAEGTPFIREKIDRGLISAEEWARAKGEFEWRHRSKLAENLWRCVKSCVKWQEPVTLRARASSAFGTSARARPHRT
jgi:hypothetical protein